MRTHENVLKHICFQMSKCKVKHFDSTVPSAQKNGGGVTTACPMTNPIFLVRIPFRLLSFGDVDVDVHVVMRMRMRRRMEMRMMMMRRMMMIMIMFGTSSLAQGDRETKTCAKKTYVPIFNSPRRRRNRSFVNMRTLLEDTNRVDDETTRCKNLTSMSFF